MTIKIGETRRVFPPENVGSMRVKGQTISSEGTPLEITQQLLALHEAGMLQIEEDGAPAAAEPAPPPPPPASPPPTPPAAPPVPEGFEGREKAQRAEGDAAKDLPTAEQIDAMSDDNLKDFLISIGFEPKGQKRATLVRRAKVYLENVANP
jgi:hypothetical protein